MSQTEQKNRRAANRRQPRGGSKIVCAAGKYGLGPNVAVSVLDVSETGWVGTSPLPQNAAVRA